MKRKILALCAAIGLLNSVNAQVSAYSFTQSTGIYTPITGGIILGDSESDDERFVDAASPLGSSTTTGVGFPLDFNFTYNGIVFDRLAINTNGWISLGQSALTPSVNIHSSPDSYSALSAISTANPALLRNRIAALNGDLAGQTGSELRVETIGNSPNKVCVIQWKNYKRYGDTACHYNFQIRLSETSNLIDFVYGTMLSGSSNTLTQVGLGGTINSDFNNRSTTTDWSATTAGGTNTATCTLSSDAFPESGQTFTWTPALPCAGMPEAGSAFAPSMVCSGMNFDLVLEGYTSNVGGITFQWQSSPSGSTGTFTNLFGGTTAIFRTMQTSTTWYQCIVTCTSSGESVASNVVSAAMDSPTNCYCTSSANYSSDEEIVNVTLGSLNNSSTCSTTGGTGSSLNEYSNFTSVTAPDLPRSANVPFSVQVGTCGSGQYLNLTQIFIDYNQNGSFADAGETVYSSSAINGDHLETGVIPIPVTAQLGNTRMRVVNMEKYASDTAINACGTYGYGETEDYIVNIVAALLPCTGTPTAGTISSSIDSACGSSTISLALSGYSSTTSGIMIQWQSSPSGLTGTFTNIVGGTMPSFTTTQTATTWYQCVVTCTASGLSATTIAKGIFQKPFANCYCTSTATNPSDEDILNVTLATLNNSSTCMTTGGAGSVLNKYSDFTSVAAPNLARTAIVPFSVQIGTCDGNYENAIKMFIDFNQNGSFDDIGETVFTSVSSTSGDHFETGYITIPLTAVLGNTRMRIVNKETGSPSSISGCSTYSYGETEDYIVNITPVPPACTGTPTAGIASASSDSVCGGANFSLVLTGYSSDVAGLTFQWQSSPTGLSGTFTNIAGGTTPSFIAMQTATTFYQCIVTCTSSGQPATSNLVTVTLNAPSNCYCSSNATFAGDEEILNVTLGTLNNSSTCATTGGSGSIMNQYSNFTSIAAPNLPQTASVPFSVQVGTCGGNYGSAIKMFIDFNQNGSFSDAGETVYSSVSSVSGAYLATGIISIPLTATLGNTKMRVVNKETSLPSSISDCGTYGYGETEDYLVNITGVPPACTGAPTTGTALVSADSVCSTDFNLLLDGTSSDVSGLTYQWQSSPTGLTGSFTSITGGITPSFTTQQTATAWYQCIVTCTASSQTATSNAVAVYQRPLTDCYCMPLHSYGCDSTDNIDGVTILTTSLVNTGTGCTGASGLSYTLYQPTGNTTASLITGITYTLQVTTKTDNIVSVWIDFNQNGMFETNEWKQVCDSSVAGTPNSVSITVPTGTLNGQTRMRIRSRLRGNTNDSLSACVSFGSGETEDYTITINSPVGISENSFENLQIYPNPTTGDLNVNFKAESNKLSIRLVNVEGQLVYNENIEHFSGTYSSVINIGEKAKGIYFLQITSDNKVTTKKVVLY